MIFTLNALKYRNYLHFYMVNLSGDELQKLRKKVEPMAHGRYYTIDSRHQNLTIYGIKIAKQQETAGRTASKLEVR